MNNPANKCLVALSLLLPIGVSSLGAEYRYPDELPKKTLKLEVEDRYYSNEERHMSTLIADDVPAKQIRDSRPFESVLLHIRNPDGSDWQVAPLCSSYAPPRRGNKLDRDIESVTFWWEPDFEKGEIGDTYPCYISYDAGEKKWATREFSLKVGGKGRHARCNKCFGIGMAPTVSLSDITTARMNAMSGGASQTMTYGSLERRAAIRMNAMQNNNQSETTDSGSLAYSSSRRLNEVVLSRDGQGRDVKLHSSIPIYSLKALPRAEMLGQLQAGMTVHIVEEINPKLVHVRFTTSSKRVFEGVARYADLGVQRMAGLSKHVEIPGWGKLEMVWCPPGRFTMGSPAWEEWRDEDEIPHTVILTHGFWMSKYEVTQGLWNHCMEAITTYGEPVGDQYPAIDITWDDAQALCSKLQENTGLAFRLPTEAEWEYACRAGSPDAWAGEKTPDAVGWYTENSGRKLHLPGEKEGNAWGLFDMLGNASEWCSDWYGTYPQFTVTDPVGPAMGEERVCRGGDYSSPRYQMRCADRVDYPPEATVDTGMRLVIGE